MYHTLLLKDTNICYVLTYNQVPISTLNQSLDHVSIIVLSRHNYNY